MKTIWIGPSPNNNFPHWTFKKDAPSGKSLIQIEFRFATVYMEIIGNSLFSNDGQQVPLHVCYTVDGKRLIGFRDLTAADGTEHETVWRESVRSTIQEALA